MKQINQIEKTTSIESTKQTNIPLVSIIVPVYNVEKYLHQCLESIVSQTLENIEIIVINDGSKDNSLSIIKEFANKDNRIKIIDKPNEGYGKTMNLGLDIATSEYIGIIESDDWIEKNMFEELYKLAIENNVDVVKSNFFDYTTSNGEQSIIKKILPDGDLNCVLCPREKSAIFWCPPSIWSAIYKKDFLNKNKIRFLESLGASYQDTGFSFKVWAMANRAWLTSKSFLHYRCDSENSSSSSKDKVFCICDEWDEIERFLNNYPKYKKDSYQLRCHIKLGNYMWNLNRLCGETKKQFHQRFAQEYKVIIKNGGLNKTYFSDKQWLELRYIFEPNSFLLLFMKKFQFISRIFLNISRIFLKSRILRGKKRWYALFGLIPVYKKRIKPITFTQEV